MTSTFTPSSPVRNVETAPFWDAAREERLLVKICDGCTETFFYPRDLCPFCLSDTSWLEASGIGTIYSYTAVHPRGDPYVVALVSLEEGPTMIANVIGTDPASLTIGQQVRVAFIETDGAEVLPVFVIDAQRTAADAGR